MTCVQLKKKGGKFRNEFPIAWANLTVFDFRAFLRSGKLAVNTWPYKSELDELLNPLDTTMINPDNAHPLLTIEFESVCAWLHSVPAADVSLV